MHSYFDLINPCTVVFTWSTHSLPSSSAGDVLFSATRGRHHSVLCSGQWAGGPGGTVLQQLLSLPSLPDCLRRRPWGSVVAILRQTSAFQSWGYHSIMCGGVWGCGNVCVCVCAHMCVCVCVRLRVPVCACTHIFVLVQCVCVHACMRVCMCVHICTLVCVSMYLTALSIILFNETFSSIN